MSDFDDFLEFYERNRRPSIIRKPTFSRVYEARVLGVPLAVVIAHLGDHPDKTTYSLAMTLESVLN